MIAAKSVYDISSIRKDDAASVRDSRRIRAESGIYDHRAVVRNSPTIRPVAPIFPRFDVHTSKIILRDTPACFALSNLQGTLC